ncbi:MAG: tRNA (N(6)-L-threonylcarbamoyladenosine(37)-C(2))-methylthiotransferase MtaB [Rickettsiaceae bacterium]|nr:tRNA (N(6)-L-threonylcarbamoyladenosine(37)-C(2))-methylthiotransferase MtaB [Rickettsiaceae bacterium]
MLDNNYYKKASFNDKAQVVLSKKDNIHSGTDDGNDVISTNYQMNTKEELLTYDLNNDESKNNSSVITFGCRLNIYESELIKANIRNSSVTGAVVFNTCAVTKQAEQDAVKSIRKYRRENPDAEIIVTGCAAQTNPDLFSSMPEVDKILGNEEKLYAHNYLKGSERIILEDIMTLKELAPHYVNHFTEHSRAFLQVQNGCDHRCTFCIIPYARGNSRSVPIGQIVTQVRSLVANNYKEIVLTGVDVTSYGNDLPGKPSLGQMIRRLLNLVPELKRLRLASIDVAEIDEELLELMKHEERLMPYFHISIQAGDDMILKRMKRRHKRNDVIKFCDQIRSYRKNVTFGADMITGFPTETNEMFMNSLKLVEEANLQFLHIFPYSERPGTPASRMPQVEKNIRKERAKILRDAGAKNLDIFSKKMHGQREKILIEKNNKGHAENFLSVNINSKIQEGTIVNTLLEYRSGELIGISL